MNNFCINHNSQIKIAPRGTHIFYAKTWSGQNMCTSKMERYRTLLIWAYFSYVLSFIPKSNFTIPLKNLGTFFTTIVIITYLLLRIYYPHSHISPTATTTTPIINSQPDIGSNNTSNIPSPKPIKQTANVFFNAHNIIITSHFI